jgi:hypothetical protein
MVTEEIRTLPAARLMQTIAARKTPNVILKRHVMVVTRKKITQKG